MLSLIKQLHAQYVRSSTMPGSTKSQTPLAIAQETIQALAKSLNVPNADKITAAKDPGGLSEAVSCRLGGKPCVRLGSLLFLDDTKIPEKFRYTKTNKLDFICNRKMIQEFANWANKELGRPQQKITHRERTEIAIYLRVIRNLEKAKNSLQHGIGHELGHVFYENPIATDLTKSVVNWILAGIVAGPAAGSAFIPLTMLGIVAGSAVGIVLLAVTVTAATSATFICIGIVFLKVGRKIRFPHPHTVELRADLFGASDIKTTKGGIYYFKTLKKLCGDGRGATHPLNSVRIRALQQHLNTLKHQPIRV